jgi:hypothetical protein
MLGDDPEPGPGGGQTTSEPTGGTPTTTEPTEPPKPEIVGPVSGDQDGDGLGDVTVRWSPDGKDFERVATWTSDGSRMLLEDQGRVKTSRKVSRQEALGDFDGDDRLEQLTVDVPQISGPLTVKGTMSGGEKVQQTVTRPRGQQYVTAMVSDADADGLDDLLLLTWGDRPTMVLSTARSTGTTFTNPKIGIEVPFGYEDTSAEVGDLDGDGRADLALLTTPSVPAGDAVSSTVRTYLGRADDTLGQRGKARTFRSQIGPDLYALDIDGDEDTELLVNNDQNSFLELVVLDHRPGGIGAPRPAGLFPQPPTSYYDSEVAVGDYDGDGRDDVAAVGRAPAGKQTTVQVALSNGKGFGGATKWGTWDGVTLTDTYGLSVLGGTFP